MRVVRPGVASLPRSEQGDFDTVLRSNDHDTPITLIIVRRSQPAARPRFRPGTGFQGGRRRRGTHQPATDPEVQLNP